MPENVAVLPARRDEPLPFPSTERPSAERPSAERLTVSKSLMLQLDSRGRWTGANSVSRAPQELGDDALPLLAAFARPTTRSEALDALAEEWEIEPEEFHALVTKLVDLGFLTSETTADASLAVDGFARVLPHFFMIRDAIRVAAYRGAVERACAGKTVLEIGCGSGILSIFAAQAGAEKVVAIEESRIADVAERMFEANRCADVVDLRRGNSRDVEIDEPVDVVIHEILGTDPFQENMLVFLEDARKRFLKPGGRMLPHRLQVACVGIELEEPPTVDRERALLEARQFATAYGMSFDPLIEELGRTPESRFPRPMRFPRDEPFRAPILTDEQILWDLDLGAPFDDLERAGRLTLDVRRAGRLGAVLLFFHAHLDEHTVLSTSPFAPPTHWGWDVRGLSKEIQVEAGTTVELTYGTEVEYGAQRVVVDWP